MTDLANMRDEFLRMGFGARLRAVLCAGVRIGRRTGRIMVGELGAGARRESRCTEGGNDENQHAGHRLLQAHDLWIRAIHGRIRMSGRGSVA